MTLVLSFQSRKSIWLLTDRRLSYGLSRSPKDDAIKVMNLETKDGAGLLAYAGLGATPLGTEPSTWMSAVLRGRGGLTFEQSLGVLTDVASRELPRHLVRLPGRAHFIVVPAFIENVGVRLYTIDNALHPESSKHFYRFTSHQRSSDPASDSVHLALAGTGGLYLAAKTDKSWARSLRRLVKANDRGQVTDLAVADYLATINNDCHRSVRDGSVGPKSLVVWRRRRGVKRVGGGGHEYYSGLERTSEGTIIPAIGNGMDISAIAKMTMEEMVGKLAQGGFDGFMNSAFDADRMNQLLAAIPSEPDEHLR